MLFDLPLTIVPCCERQCLHDSFKASSASGFVLHSFAHVRWKPKVGELMWVLFGVLAHHRCHFHVHMSSMSAVTKHFVLAHQRYRCHVHKSSVFAVTKHGVLAVTKHALSSLPSTHGVTWNLANDKSDVLQRHIPCGYSPLALHVQGSVPC